MQHQTLIDNKCCQPKGLPLAIIDILSSEI